MLEIIRGTGELSWNVKGLNRLGLTCNYEEADRSVSPARNQSQDYSGRFGLPRFDLVDKGSRNVPPGDLRQAQSVLETGLADAVRINGNSRSTRHFAPFEIWMVVSSVC